MGFRNLLLLGATWLALAAPHALAAETAPAGLDTRIQDLKGDVIRYSDNNGSAWTTPTPDVHYEFKAVTWDGTRFIAVGGHRYENGIVLASGDGVSWSRTCLGSCQQLLCAASGGTRTAVAGFNGSAFTTEDTTTWNGAPSGTDDYTGLVWAGTRFVRVGRAGLIETSTDGAAWTRRTSGTTEDLVAVAWNGSRFVAVGNDSALGRPLVLTSPDAISWTKRDMSAHAGSVLNAVAATSDTFVACSQANDVLTSSDGSVWSAHNSGLTAFIYGLFWTGSRLLALGEGGLIMSTDDSSPDSAADWTVRSASSPEPSINGFAEKVITVPRIVAVGDHGTIFTSDDGGLTGVQRVSGTTNDLYDVTATTRSTSPQFIAVGANGTIIDSADGIIWNTRSSGTTNNLIEVTWFHSMTDPSPPHRAIAVGDSGTILTSDYGSSWTSRTSGTTEALRGVAAGYVVSTKPPYDITQRIVAVGFNGTILSSSGGTTWTAHSSGTTEPLFAVFARSASTGGFIAVGGHGTVLTSRDGITWTSRDTGTALYFYDVTETDSHFVAVGEQGAAFTSPTGATWTRRYPPASFSLFAVHTISDGTLIAGGYDGQVLASGVHPDFGDWIAAHGVPANQDDPDDDPNGDGINNLTAYAFGVDPLAPPAPEDFQRLPRLVDPRSGEHARIRLQVSDGNLGDVIYLLYSSETMQAGSWTEIHRHDPGQECGSGSVHVHPGSGGLAELEIPEPMGALPRKFYRLDIQLSTE